MLTAGERMGKPLPSWCTLMPSGKEWRKCARLECLVRVLRLVDGDKPVMGYLYEAMDSTKEAIRNYYVGKGTPGNNKHMLLWDLIDSRWTGMLHRPIHAAGLFLNPAFAYKCNFDFDGRFWRGSSLVFRG